MILDGVLAHCAGRELYELVPFKLRNNVVRYSFTLATSPKLHAIVECWRALVTVA